MAKFPVIAFPDSQVLRRAPAPGLRSVALYAAVAVALELAAADGEPLVAVIGYALLILLIVNQIGVALLRSSGEGARAVAPAIMLAVPAGLRLVALTLEPGPVPVSRQFVLVGPTAVTALVCATVCFAELRPQLDLLLRDWRQRLIALSGLPVGLFAAWVFDRNSLAPPHGVWSHGAALLVLVTAAAVTEELLFRGYVQTALRRLVGNLAPAFATAAVALAYLGVLPARFVGFAVLLGLCSSVLVEVTGHLEGVIAARMALYAGLFVFWPRLFGLH
jgi:membrane protease YdiL (CAAX protease family)